MELRTIDHPVEGWDPWWAGSSGAASHRLGLYEGAALLGAVVVHPAGRLRLAHRCEIGLRAERADHADALLGAVCTFVDQWSAYDRIQLMWPADHVGIEVAVRHGFEVEVRRVDRLGPGRDELVLGRLRPGWTPRAPGDPPPWPAPRPSSGEPVFRPLMEEDMDAVRAMSTEATVVWGTLQIPWSNLPFYVERHQGTPPGHTIVGMEVDGVLAGMGGLHPTKHEGVVVLGMTIDVRWQGRGLGGRMLDHVLALGREAGARRVELGVYADNTRAVALYASRGFVAEGTLRCDAIRAGGYADSVEMAVLW
ncbi:MAG: GNAT family N-acetyltransferase [Alphaproteobacteria bacterium]|nr:GNAT family N-acetyltransferase [Alphaproteobacteria bacterium]MCB9699523.1 GNAT family N-acetyltransferase [Alphaproteobacteria bacterium]